MKSIVTNARITLIRFGKSCPFVLCFIVLISDIENIYAILTHDVVYCNNTLIYNTPISFAIGANFEYDLLTILYDLWHLMKCDYIYLLDGWTQSKGAKVERDVARVFGIKRITTSINLVLT